MATALLILGMVSWPPGGLLFALPFVFLVPGVTLAVLGAVLVALGRHNPHSRGL